MMNDPRYQDFDYVKRKIPDHKFSFEPVGIDDIGRLQVGAVLRIDKKDAYNHKDYVKITKRTPNRINYFYLESKHSVYNEDETELLHIIDCDKENKYIAVGFLNMHKLKTGRVSVDIKKNNDVLFHYSIDKDVIRKAREYAVLRG